MNKKIAVFRVVSLCIQLASGCASLEQEPMNAPQAATPPGYVSQAFRDRIERGAGTGGRNTEHWNPQPAGARNMVARRSG